MTLELDKRSLKEKEDRFAQDIKIGKTSVSLGTRVIKTSKGAPLKSLLEYTGREIGTKTYYWKEIEITCYEAVSLVEETAPVRERANRGGVGEEKRHPNSQFKKRDMVSSAAMIAGKAKLLGRGRSHKRGSKKE